MVYKVPLYFDGSSLVIQHSYAKWIKMDHISLDDLPVLKWLLSLATNYLMVLTATYGIPPNLLKGMGCLESVGARQGGLVRSEQLGQVV